MSYILNTPEETRAMLSVIGVETLDDLFADIPPAAYLYPVPYEWYEDWGIRRYGFHGTSHAYCTGRAAEMLRRDVVSGSHAELRLVICHLGQGSSATAVRGGAAVTNTMGFTPLEGFMMGTRSGTVDPGILIYVQREHGLTAEQRVAFVMFEIEGFSCSEIAKQLGLPLGTVHSRLHAARKGLRASLERLKARERHQQNRRRARGSR